VRIDDYVVDVLMRDLVAHDKTPSAFFVYLFFWRRAGGNVRRTVAASLREIAEETGLSKRAVQAAVALLARRRLLQTSRASITAIPEYRISKPWHIMEELPDQR
jgi:hypothetical protein